MKFKIKETYLLLIIVMGLVSLSVYSTYALFTASTTIDDVVSFNATLNTDNNLIEYEMVTLASGEVKMIEININNTYSTSLYYGAWYQIVSPSDTTDIVVGLTDDNTNSGSGALAKTSSIKLIVGLANNSSKTAIINIGTVGSTTSNLNLPTGRNLIPEGFSTTNADLIINSFKVNGTEATTFPINTGSYNVNTTCSDANITYNPKTLRYEVSNISKNKNAKCGFTYTTKSNITYLNDYIISLSGTTQGTGQVVNENGYRYEGKNPNNYIYFNNELWRIIGVFDSSSHGVSNTNLVKIIRNDSIGSYAWNNGTNDWPNSSLYHMLNDYYYNATDGTASNYCYVYTGLGNLITGECNFVNLGLKVSYRNMVQTVTWYLGGVITNAGSSTNDTDTPSVYYTYERDSTKVYTGRSASTTGNVGLMYASDYGYSALASDCSRSIEMGQYLYNDNCVDYNWTQKKTKNEWTITPNRGFNYISQHISNGSLYGEAVEESKSVHPVMYLKADVKYVDGDGSITNPYIIGI